ncbi:MAG: hypothetical protein U5K28_04840 [Halobacteriales archaeon]|nr:hypothetical protein [Halobacteriales archaeon]
MQRRTLLGLAASAGVVGVLAGAGGVPDEPSAPPAKYAEEPVSQVRDWPDPIVATDTTTAGNERYGTVRQHASILDLESTGRYALITRYRLIPGSNYDATSRWKTNSLTVEHAWRSGSLVSYVGDVVPADDGDADSNLYLGTERSTGQHRWQLTFNVATGDSRTLRFVTIVDRDELLQSGDSPVDATFGAGFTEGFLRASEQDVATVRLMIRGTDKESS